MSRRLACPPGSGATATPAKRPVGIVTQDPELEKRLDVPEWAERVAKFNKSLPRVMALLARPLGKSEVHCLEPEDTAALTIEASAMARVPSIRRR